MTPETNDAYNGVLHDIVSPLAFLSRQFSTGVTSPILGASRLWLLEPAVAGPKGRNLVWIASRISHFLLRERPVEVSKKA
jgi:hypothetical protein